MIALACGIGPGCQPATPHAAAGPTPPKAAAPSKVSGAVKEADLAKLEMTEKAEQRLGVVVVEAKKQPVPRAVSYGGEVWIPPGRLISVASPFLGTVEAPPGVKLPMPGAHVDQGQPIFVVRPILSPEARATLEPLKKDAEGQVKAAEQQLKIAQTALQRSEEAVRQKLMPQASLIDAQAQYDVAQTALKAGEERLEEIRKIAGDPNAGGGMTTLTFKAPVNGILQNIHAQVGQPVPAGALLFDVAELDPIWVKVPVYVGDLERLAVDKPAGVGSLSAAPGVNVRPRGPSPPPARPTPWRRPSISSTRSRTRTAP